MRSCYHSLLLQKQKLIQNSLLLPKQNLTINNAKAAPIHWRLPHVCHRQAFLFNVSKLDNHFGSLQNKQVGWRKLLRISLITMVKVTKGVAVD